MASYHPFHSTQSVRPWELNPRLGTLPRHTPIIDSWKAPQTTLIEPPIEHTEGLKIVIILDESGSMSDIKNQMIKSINDLIKELSEGDTILVFKDNKLAKESIHSKHLIRDNVIVYNKDAAPPASNV